MNKKEWIQYGIDREFVTELCRYCDHTYEHHEGTKCWLCNDWCRYKPKWVVK